MTYTLQPVVPARDTTLHSPEVQGGALVIGAGGREYGAIAGDDPTFEQHQFARRVCFDPRTPLDGIVKRVATVLTAALTRSKAVSIRVVAAEIGLSHVPRASRMAQVQGPAG